jgi:hypothetical protein
VREARTTLAIDLSAAAGALEDGRPEVARDIVAATSAEMASLPLAAERSAVDDSRPSVRRRRLLIALPAVPLLGAVAMSAAAAIGASTSSSTPTSPHQTVIAEIHRPVVAAHLPGPTSERPPSDSARAHTSATTTLHRLEHVVNHDPRASQVLAVANDLHNQLTAMIATSTLDPGNLHVVRQLLTLEQHVLESSKVPGTQLALAASRAIARLLDLTPSPTPTTAAARATPHATASPRPTTSPSPTASSIRRRQPTTSPHATAGHAPNATPPDTLFGKGVFGRR